jgi:ubiquitin-conjugating enzyme E2 A
LVADHRIDFSVTITSFQESVMNERLTSEFSEILRAGREHTAYFTAKPRDGNMAVWDAVIYGPENSEWTSATLQAGLCFPPNYPYDAPRVFIRTPDMFHSNVEPSTGYFCLELYTKWTPDHNIMSLITTIQTVLAAPNPDSPANREAANLYVNNRTAYYRRVAEIVASSHNH